MKLLKKVIAILLLIVIVVLAGLLSYLKFVLPNVGDAPDITIEASPERTARGEYLANSVMGCIDCHSTRDWTKFAGPLIPGTEGMGGEEFTSELGFPGDYYAPNITPDGIENWTDGELFRAITTGVSKDGKALFPIMPYVNYGKLDKEDIYSVITYLKTIKSVKNDVKESSSNFPMNFIINLIPREADFISRPELINELEYGKYMLTASGCYDCHTKQEKGRYIEEMAYAGGFEFPLPTGGIVSSSNITPDKETGIGNWTEEFFINRFKMYKDSIFTPHEIKDGEYNTFMPWIYYATMEEQDLKAIYKYIMTIDPIKNKVTKFSAP